MARTIDFWTLLKMTQEYISSHYATVLTDETKLPQLKAYIDKYLRDSDCSISMKHSIKRGSLRRRNAIGPNS